MTQQVSLSLKTPGVVHDSPVPTVTHALAMQQQVKQKLRPVKF